MLHQCPLHRFIVFIQELVPESSVFMSQSFWIFLFQKKIFCFIPFQISHNLCEQICCKHISFLEKEKVLNAILGLKISNYLIFVGKRFMNFRKDLHNTFFFTRLIYQLPLIRVVSTNDSNLQKWQNCRRLLNFQLGLPNLKLIVGHI